MPERTSTLALGRLHQTHKCQTAALHTQFVDAVSWRPPNRLRRPRWVRDARSLPRVPLNAFETGVSALTVRLARFRTEPALGWCKLFLGVVHVHAKARQTVRRALARLAEMLRGHSFWLEDSGSRDSLRKPSRVFALVFAIAARTAIDE